MRSDLKQLWKKPAVPVGYCHRAILGMLDVDGREVMRKHFHRDTMTLTLPTSLFKDMEMEAGDSIFQTPAWKSLMNANRPVITAA